MQKKIESCSLKKKYKLLYKAPNDKTKEKFCFNFKQGYFSSN